MTLDQWKLQDDGNDWYPPREIRLEVFRNGESMSLAVAECVADSIDSMAHWVRIFLTGTPDPMHRVDIADVIQIFRTRAHLAPIWMQTNGRMLDVDDNPMAISRDPDRVMLRVANKLSELLTAGVSVITFVGSPEVEHIWRVVRDRAAWLEEFTGVKVVVDRPRGRAIQRDYRLRTIFLVWHERSLSRPIYDLAETRCMEPHTTLVVQVDGSIPLCKADTQCLAYMGHAGHDIKQIWYSDWFKAARARAWAGLRDVGPCIGCNRRTDQRSWANHHQLAQRNLPTEEARRHMVNRVRIGGGHISRVGLENSTKD